MTGFLLKKDWMLPCPFAKSLRELVKIHLQFRKKSRNTVLHMGTIHLMSPPINVLSPVPARRSIFAVTAVPLARKPAVPAIFATAFVRTSFSVPITVTFWTKHHLSVTAAQKKSTAVWISFTTEPQLLIANTGRSLQRPEPVSTSQKMTSRFWMN
jgi:hypothetical protein